MHCDRSTGAKYCSRIFDIHVGLTFASALKGFQIGDNVADLTGVETKFGHGRMAGDDSLGQRILEIFDRIALVERAEWRRDRQGTLADLPDCVAARAVGANDNRSTLRRRRQRLFAFGLQCAQAAKAARFRSTMRREEGETSIADAASNEVRVRDTVSTVNPR